VIIVKIERQRGAEEQPIRRGTEWPCVIMLIHTWIPLMIPNRAQNAAASRHTMRRAFMA